MLITNATLGEREGRGDVEIGNAAFSSLTRDTSEQRGHAADGESDGPGGRPLGPSVDAQAHVHSAPHPARVVLGLDVGTTAAKAVAFALGGGWRHVAAREYPLLEPSPGWQVQDPSEVAAALLDALAECVSAAARAQVVGVSVSTAMHGLLGLDEHKRPLTPLLTWADARSWQEAQQLRASGLAVDLHRRTGTPVHPMTPLTKLMWLRRHRPETVSAARWWVGLKDYVLWCLTGELVTELSSASGTGLLDLSRRAWDPAALELAGIPAEVLPPVLPTTASLPLAPETASRVGLPSGLPVILGAGDGPLGNLGTGATTPGAAGLSLGTSGAVRMIVPQPQIDPSGALFCYALTEEAWVLGGAVSNGGIVVRWAASALAPDLANTADPSAADIRLLELAESVTPGCDGLLMLPYLLAERAPLWDPTLPGAYLGLRREHTRGHLVRAAVEGVCLQLGTIVDRLHHVEPVTSVRVTGGVFRSALWRQVLAAVLDRPLRVGGDAEGTALGAAALGLYALGISPGLDDASAMLASEPGATSEVSPDPLLVVAYARTRASLPHLIDSLGPVAELVRSTASPATALSTSPRAPSVAPLER